MVEGINKVKELNCFVYIYATIPEFFDIYITNSNRNII